MAEANYRHLTISKENYSRMSIELDMLKAAIETYRKNSAAKNEVMKALYGTTVDRCLEFDSITSSADNVCDMCERILSAIEIQ